MGHKDSLAYEPWPKYDPKYLIDEEIELIVQIDGKVRGRIMVKKGIEKEEVIRKAKETEAIGKWLEKATISKVIYVPDKLLNFVLEKNLKSQ